MASFNLGRVVGSTGAAGEKGDAGAKGDKGDKGDRGEKGADGYTPVFSVGTTQTLSAQSNARVEINSDDPKNPVLNFYIPRGSDGASAAGDMQSAFYDTENRKTDIFRFVEQSLLPYLKKSGGELTGELSAYAINTSSSCVRNICVTSDLPETAKNGDICLCKKTENVLKLSDCETGSTIFVKENGAGAEYILADMDFHITGGVTLIRKYLFPDKTMFDRGSNVSYNMSSVDLLHTCIHEKMFSDFIRKNLLDVTIETNLKRKVFSLSYSEVSSISYLKSNSIVAKIENSNSTGSYWTRTNNTSGSAYAIGENGGKSSYTASSELYTRPVIVLPKTLSVINAQAGSETAYEVSEGESGIYVYNGGQWEECLI